MKTLIRLVKQEHGASAVIVALSLSFLLVFAALSLDYGMSYMKTAETQNAADAAALAAGKLLPIRSDNSAAVEEAKQTAISYADLNEGFTITEDNVEFDNIVNGKFTRVRITVPCQSQVYFGKVFGLSSIQIKRYAAAQVAPGASASNVAPLGVDYLQLNEAIASGNTQHIYLKYGGGDGDTGSYGAIDLDGVMGGGANDFESWLTYGYEGTISVGDDLLPVEKGNMAGPTESAISVRYNQCTHFPGLGGCTVDHYDPDCPRIIKILVIEKVNSSYIKVRGFATFVIEGSNADEVIGSYVKTIEPGNVNENADWINSEYGVYNLSLSQ